MTQKEKCVIAELGEPIDALCTNRKRTKVGIGIKAGKFKKTFKNTFRHENTHHKR